MGQNAPINISPRYENYAMTWWTQECWLEWVAQTLHNHNYFDPCPQVRPDGFDGLLTDWFKFKSWYANHPGSRGSAKVWWEKAHTELQKGSEGIWCAFNSEQLRHMKPNPLSIDGYLVLPHNRLKFIWGGPDMVKVKGKLVPQTEETMDLKIYRAHKELVASPGNWSVFWSSVKPAKTPEPCDIIKTGAGTWVETE